MEEPFTSKKRRKSSFYRKSVGVSEFDDRTSVVPISEMGLTTFNITSVSSTVSNRDSTICPRQIEVLKSEVKQWKELLKDLKNRYEAMKSEEFSAIDWVREGPCLTEADKQFIKEMPDYNKIFRKHEDLKELMITEARTRAELDNTTEEFLKVFEAKLQEQTKEVVQRLSSEFVSTSDILGPLHERNDSGFVMEPFLSDSDSDSDMIWEKMDS